MADPYGYGRPTDVALTDSINTFRRKVNQIGNDIGNKLRLDSGTDSLWGYVPSFHSDSDIVGALLELDYRIREQDSDLYLRTDGGDLFIVNGKKGNAIHMQLTWDSAANTVELDFPRHSVTIDAAGDISLDADGGDVFLKDAGTQYGALTNSSGNLVVKSGTSTVMTGSGNNATFNNNVDIDNDLTVDRDAQVTRDLNVDGLTTLDSTTIDGTLDVNDSANISGNLTVTGSTILNGHVDLGDGTGDNISIVGRVDTNIIPDADDTYDLGSSGLQWKDLYVDGTANIDSLVADTADINAGTIDNTTVGASTPSTGNFTTLNATTTTLDSTTVDGPLSVTGATTLSSTLAVTGQTDLNGHVNLGDADADNISIIGRVDTSIIPDADGSLDLGSSGLEWRNLYIDGTANIDSLVADTADINAGTIDNTSVGASTPSTGNFTTLNATTTTLDSTTVDGSLLVSDSAYVVGNLNIGGNVDISGTLVVDGTVNFKSGSSGAITLGDTNTDNVVFNADVNSHIIPNTDDTYDLGSSGQQWRNLYVDGTANIDALVADTADINGGSVDGATIGANSASTGNFTTLNATTTTLDSTTIDGPLDLNGAADISGNVVTSGTLVTGTALTTTATDHAAAINELDSDIGIIANMTTTTKLSVIAAINELNSRIIDVYDSAGTLLNPA